MFKRLITTVVWFLLLAIPFQGYAAVSTAVGHSCSALQTQTNAGHHTRALGSTHQHQQHHFSSATTDAHQHATTDAMTSNHHHGDTGTDKNGSFKCSNCASCCIGSIINYSLASMPPAQPVSSERIPFAQHHVTAHIPPGLERPPLFALI